MKFSIPLLNFIHERRRARMKYLSWLILVATLLLALSACDVTIPASNPLGTATYTTGGEPHFGRQTKTSGCVAHGGLPDSACTPGAIFPNATLQEICRSGYTKTVRNVPVSEKDQVYAEYGIFHHSSGQYEVDHLIPLELGGSNDISNLWPEAASPQPGFHQKDKV